MRKAHWPLGLFAVTGCAQLAGIDETSQAVPQNATLSIERVSVGATVETNPQPLTGLSAFYLVEDAAGPGGFTRIEATVDGTTWTADLEGERRPVLFEMPVPSDPSRNSLLLYDLPSPALRVPLVVLERIGAVPALPEATLTVDVTLDTPYVDGEQIGLVTMGVWNSRSLAPPLAGSLVVGPEQFAYTSMTSTTGRPHEKITTLDTMFATRYSGTKLIGIAQASPFDQSDADTSVSMAMSPVMPNKNLTLTVSPTAAAPRIAAARPAVGAPSFQYQVLGSPGTGRGVSAGAVLFDFGIVSTETTEVVTAYGNPFASKWTDMITYIGAGTRTYTNQQGLALTLVAGMSDIAPYAATQTFDFKAGFPERISINSTSLSTDNVMIPFPVAPVVIEVETDRADNTIYQASIIEILPNEANTALRQREVISALSDKPRFVIPPEVFQAGRFYIVRSIVVAGGYPNLADGNLVDVALPVSTALVDSGVFGVMQ